MSSSATTRRTWRCGAERTRLLGSREYGAALRFAGGDAGAPYRLAAECRRKRLSASHATGTRTRAAARTFEAADNEASDCERAVGPRFSGDGVASSASVDGHQEPRPSGAREAGYRNRGEGCEAPPAFREV